MTFSEDFASDAEEVRVAGVRAAERGDVAEAVSLFRVAATMGSVAALSDLGQGLDQLGRHDEAAAAFAAAIDAGDTSARVWLGVMQTDHLGQQAAGEGLLEEAARDHEPEALHQLALWRMRQERFEDAVALLHDLTSTEKGDARVSDSLGDALRFAQRPEAACDAYRSAIKDGYDDAYLGLAFALADMDADDDAEAAFREAWRRRVDEAAASLASWLDDMGRPEDARAALETEAGREDPDISALEDLGNLLCDSPSTFAEGLVQLRRAVYRGSDSALDSLAEHLARPHPRTARSLAFLVAGTG